MEFNELLEDLLGVLEERKIEAGLRRNQKWALCFDGATAHGDAASVIGNRAEIWPQPAHSPDMNKPIEHVHAQLDDLMHKWMREMRKQTPPVRLNPDLCKAQATSLFYQLPAEKIEADVKSLWETYRAIDAADGKYVAARLS